MNAEVRKQIELAELYLLDGATKTALRHLGKALQILDPSLPEGEDPGDVSTHLLKAEAL